MGLDLKVLMGVLLAVCGLATVGALVGLRINTTPSHPIGIYRIVDREPAVGLYAMFCAPAKLTELPTFDPNVPPICTEDQNGRTVNGGVKTCHWGGAKVGQFGARALELAAFK